MLPWWPRGWTRGIGTVLTFQASGPHRIERSDAGEGDDQHGPETTGSGVQGIAPRCQTGPEAERRGLCLGAGGQQGNPRLDAPVNACGPERLSAGEIPPEAAESRPSGIVNGRVYWRRW